MTENKQQYKTVRIYPEDHVLLKRLAFLQDKTMVEVISRALELAEEERQKNRKRFY